MAVFFPPDSLLGRYEDLLAEKNSLLEKVSTLEAKLLGSVNTPENFSLSSSMGSCTEKQCRSTDRFGTTGNGIAPQNEGPIEQNMSLTPAEKNEPRGSGRSCRSSTNSLGSGQSGCSTFETCMSTSTSLWDGDALAVQDSSYDTATNGGSPSAGHVNEEKPVPELGTFVIESRPAGKISNVGVEDHKSKREALQIVLPKLEAKNISPGLDARRTQSYHSPIFRPVSSPRMPLDGSGGARGLAYVDPEEIHTKEDVPSRLSSMSAGQINTIITTSDYLLDSSESETHTGKNGKSAGVSDKHRESKKNRGTDTVNDYICDTPKILSGTLRKGEGQGRSFEPSNRESMCSPFGRQPESESSRLSMDDLCKQMMQGIREMKKVSLDVCRRTGIKTADTSHLDIERATTLPSFSTMSACLLSGDGCDGNPSLRPTSFTSLEQIETPEAPEKDSWQIKSSLLQIRSQTSNLPLPPPNPPNQTVDLPVAGRRCVTSGKASDSSPICTGKHDLAQRQDCVLDQHSPSPYFPLHSAPAAHEAGRYVVKSAGVEEVHQTYENPLGRGGIESRDLATTGKIVQQSASHDHGVEKHVPGSSPGVPIKPRLPKPTPFPSFSGGKLGASLPSKQMPLRNFRNFCDSAYADEGKSVACAEGNAENIETGSRVAKGNVSWVIKGVHSQVSSSQGCLKEMVETVRRKLSGENLHKILLSPVSEENNGGPASRKCGKDSSIKKPELSKKHGLQNCIPFSQGVVEKSAKVSAQTPLSKSNRGFGKTKLATGISRKKTMQYVAQESRQSLMDCCFSSTCLGHRVNLSRRGRIAASQTDGARTDFVISQALVSTGTVQFDLHCDRLDGWAFVGIVAANEVDMCRPRGLAECPSSYGWTNDSEFFERGTYHFEALRELISPGANFQINVDCDRGVVSFRLARPSRRGGHQCHKRFLVCELSNLPRHDWRLVIEWLGTARFELVSVKRW